MALGYKSNGNLFGTDYDPKNEEEARLAAEGAMMGAGGMPFMNTSPRGPSTRKYAGDPASQSTSIDPPFVKSALLEILENADAREAQGLPRQSAPGVIDPPLGTTDLQSASSITPPAESLSEGAQEQGMDVNQQAITNALTDQNQGMDMNQQAIASAQGQEVTAPLPVQTLSQFMRYEDAPEQRTEQFLDEQGRLRFRPTQEALQLQAQGEVAQPPASALSSFEQDSLARQQRIGGTGSFEGDSQAMQDRLRANEVQPGESQAERDTRIAQSKTTGGQTEGLSFGDARRRAEGQLAARGVKNPSASQVNALAKGIQEGEPERLAALETEKAINEARLKTAQATLDRPEFEGNVYTVNGVTFAQTSRGGAQVIDTGTETAKESTAKMKDFEFTSQKINEAREAYLAGDLTKANDILTAAEIKQYGVQANADQFFASSTPQVTPADPTVAVAASGLTQQQEDGIQRVMADNEMTREDAIKALKEAGKLK
jgi:hypothetical protein